MDSGDPSLLTAVNYLEFILQMFGLLILQEVPNIDSASSGKTNGVEENNTAEAEAEVKEDVEVSEEDKSGGEESMDIDTECTSSQARLSVTEPVASGKEPRQNSAIGPIIPSCQL